MIPMPRSRFAPPLALAVLLGAQGFATPVFAAQASKAAKPAKAPRAPRKA